MLAAVLEDGQSMSGCIYAAGKNFVQQLLLLRSQKQPEQLLEKRTTEIIAIDDRTAPLHHSDAVTHLGILRVWLSSLSTE